MALIFCFENIIRFAVAPTMMALSGGKHASPAMLALGVVRKVALHPFIIATAIGVAAAFEFCLPAPIERLLAYLSGRLRPARCLLWVSRWRCVRCTACRPRSHQSLLSN